MGEAIDNQTPLQIDGARLVRSLALGLVGVQLALLVIDFLFAYLDLSPLKVVQHLANLAREDGIGTWFASSQALGVAVTLLALGAVERQLGRSGAGWWGIGALFAWIAMDDAIGAHERLGGMVRNMTGSAVFDLVPSYAWQVVFVPLFGAAALFMVAFTWRRSPPALRRMLIVALGCFVAAVGIDFVEGVDRAFDVAARALGVGRYTVSHGAKVTEELLEMLGTTAFLWVFASHLVLALAERPIVVRSTDG